MNFYNKMFIVTLVLLCTAKTICMDHINCHRATDEDANPILQLINDYASHDAKNSLVILPAKFRAEYVQSNIQEQKLFVACAASRAVGIKKLFIVPKNQAQDVLVNELNVHPENLLTEGTFGANHQFTTSSILHVADFLPHDIYVYTGTDYTQPDYRGKGINNQLYSYAFTCLRESILNLIRDRQPCSLHLLYGLVKKNGPNRGVDGRTIPIVKSFRRFLQTITSSDLQNQPIMFRSYKACMPTFNQHAENLDTASDTEAIEGSGCILSYQIIQKDEHAY